MDYEEEEQYEEMQAELQVEAVEIDVEDAPTSTCEMPHPQEPKLRPHPSIRFGSPH